MKFPLENLYVFPADLKFRHYSRDKLDNILNDIFTLYNMDGDMIIRFLSASHERAVKTKILETFKSTKIDPLEVENFTIKENIDENNQQ